MSGPAKKPDAEPDGFLSRWSRRKVEVRQGQVPIEDLRPPLSQQAITPQPVAAAASALPAQEEEPSSPPPPPRLTLADVDQLTAQSDFSAFAGRDVDPGVRNAAMKKLFHGDPHFNVMDGLDVYIDDYNTPDPLPKAIMRTMLQARALGLLDDELKDQDKPEPDDAAAVAAQAHTPSPHEDPDLQLQPHDAAGHAGAGTSPDAPTGPGPHSPNQPGRPGQA